MAFGGGKGAVDGFVADVGAEGLGAGFFDEFGGVAGEDVGDVAGGFGLFSVYIEGGIVVDALAAEGDPAVEAWTGRGVVTHVPLAEEAGFVAAGFEEFGKVSSLKLMGAPAGVLSMTRWVWTYRPVRKLPRLGEHRWVVTKAFVNWAPSRSMRSMFGVLRKGWPA